jgi:hypothetical protein
MQEEKDRSFLTSILRLVLRLVEGDLSSIEYLLQAGLNDYLVAILQWNNPMDIVNQFSLDLDTLINCIII